ncbi:MAG TPA: hemerythrin family protein, partial [Rhodospirillales bacterium]|nr:hemerythrin family protein [Rhodospirillales bacterium]
LADVESDDAERVIEIVIDTLTVYCRYHFAREEQVMKACRFPALPFHRHEHEGFTRAVAVMAKGRGDATAARELLDYLKGWLLHHILIQDMAYKPYVAAAPELQQMTSSVAALPPIDVSCRPDARS